MAICLGRGMGVQIGVHNIAPCFVLGRGAYKNEFSEGANMVTCLGPVDVVARVLVVRGEDCSGRLQKKWQGSYAVSVRMACK